MTLMSRLQFIERGKSLDERHWIYTPIPLDALSTAYILGIWALLGYGK